MFVDRIKVFAQAGDGGRGCVSFRREKFVPRGGPDGGDGGRGGDIILRADVHTDNLSNLFYEPIIKGKSGAHGQGKKKHGRAAIAKVVKVPVGTVVYRAEAPVQRNEFGEVVSSNGEVVEQPHRLPPMDDSLPPGGPPAPPQVDAPDKIADLTHDGEEFILCEGGGGGKGNVHFKSSRNRAPVQYTEGGEGEQGHFLFELRTMADAALVGYPNAGKSTLLGKLSAAHPKVAPYPFTTLHPIVGVVDFDGYRRASIADIPGLIEGAHRNIGLGHDFLRHITRCRILLFVLDIAGSEGRHPIEDLQSLRREINLYDPRLSERPWYVVANKMDLPDAHENLRALEERFPEREIVPISANRSEGLDELRSRLARWLSGNSEETAGEKLVGTEETVAAE
ncbi:MAG: GTPase ObgE [Verrucomicrobia bacterium]|nr:MAG: GTPase ObgE [Verrucomicrobiota bacterium]